MINLSSLLGGGMLLKQQLITADGDWVRPAKMAGNTVWLTMIGGGQSGNSGAGTSSRGGNGGEYKIQVPVDIGDLVSVLCTIGEGGAATNTVAQNNGNPTSFGAFLTCLGGSPTTANGRGAPGGQGTSGSLSQVNNGSDTPLGYGGRPNNVGYGGGGGGLNLGTNPPITNNNQGQGSLGYGAGGNGGSASIYTPGNPGAILVEWPEFV